MLAWLEADLAATRADWLIAFWHQPPYSKALFHDSVRVPDDVGTGNAKLTISFADWKNAKVASSTIEVTVVDAKGPDEDHR